MKNNTDLLLDTISNLAIQMYPHMQTVPSGQDPYGFEITKEEGKEIIVSKCGMVETSAENQPPREPGKFPRACKFYVVTVYPDDAEEKEFTSAKQAAEHFLIEQFRMNLACKSLDMDKRKEPTVRKHYVDDCPGTMNRDLSHSLHF